MIVLFITPHTNHEMITMAYSWEDKCTFIELKLMATNILYKIMNDDVYSKDMLIRRVMMITWDMLKQGVTPDRGGVFILLC
jgi:hypothetical protein